MATALKLAFSVIFGLLTFVLPLPIGGEKLFGEWGRAALFLGLLLGLFSTFAPIDNVPVLERILRSRRGKHVAIVFGGLAVLSVVGYLWMRSTIKVPEGPGLWVEMLLYTLSNLLLAYLLAVTGVVVATALMKKRD